MFAVEKREMKGSNNGLIYETDGKRIFEVNPSCFGATRERDTSPHSWNELG